MVPGIKKEARLFVDHDKYWCEVLDQRQVDVDKWYNRFKKMQEQYLVVYEKTHTDFIGGACCTEWITCVRWVNANRVKLQAGE